MPGCDVAQRADRLHYSYGSQSCFQASVIGFDDDVRVLLEYVPGGGHELVDDPRADQTGARSVVTSSSADQRSTRE